MKAISFANQKGGVGKSTLCASLAVTAGDSLILDVDPQASVSQWFQSRPETLSLPECARSTPRDVGTIIKATKRQWIFIDTPGDLTAREAIEAADLCVVPVRPSIHDLRAAAATVKLLNGKPGVFVINAAPPARVFAENSFVREARRALQAFGLPICTVVVRQRSAYIHASVAGLGVSEWTDRKAGDEIAEVWTWLSGL
jgi:chromosome partitioning protein